MKKLVIDILTFGLIQSYSIVSSDDVSAAAKTYKNCTELNKAYKGGVARSSK